MGYFSIAIYALLFIATAIYLYFKRSFSYFERNGIPFSKPSFPLGNINLSGDIHFVNSFRDIFNKLKTKEKVAGFYSFTVPSIIITDIEVLKHILVKDFNSFVNRGVFSNEENEPLTGILFNIEDDRWRFIRHKLSPVFTSGKLKNMFMTLNEKSENLVKTIERKGSYGATIEAKNLATRYTVDIISSIAFGMEANTLNDEHPELIVIIRELFGADTVNVLYFFFLFAFPNIAKKLQLRQFGKKISDFFTQVVAGNIKYRESSDEKRNDFLDMLIQLKNKGSIDGEFSSETKKLTLNEILAQAFQFFAAGADTSSTAISFALTELAFNQDIQEKLRQEILEKTEDANGEITYENINDMPYLNQVVNETLRMHAPLSFSFRKANRDYKVPGSNIVIRKDQQVSISIDAFHYDDRFWKNPTKFDPERFTQEEIAKRPPLCFMPFGEGPRNCIGSRLGLLNVKLGIATVIKNFKVTPDSQMEYPLKYDAKATTLQPKGGFLLKFEKI